MLKENKNDNHRICAFKSQRTPVEVFNDVDFEDEDIECQFNCLKNEIYLVDGSYWCIYHLPYYDRKGLLTVKGGWNEEEVDKFNKKVFKTLDYDIDTNTANNELGCYRGVIFPGDVDFSDITFKEAVDFSFSHFYGDTLFMDAHFTGDIEFSCCKWHGQISFNNTRFDAGITFDESIFNDSFIISFSFKGEYEDLNYRKQIKTISMDSCCFKGRAIFDNREFTGNSIFSSCTFHVAPAFYGSLLHQDSDFPRFDNFKDTSSKGSALAYRTLKVSMENVRNREDEGSFFALEQRSIRKSRSFFGRYLSLSSLYDVVSLYGISVLKPILFLALTQLFFIATYFYYFGMSGNSGRDAVEFSIAQIFKPFSLWARREHQIYLNIFSSHELFWLKLCSASQSIVSIILLGLLLFAIRWRYKRG
jgi:hypothetical protein